MSESQQAIVIPDRQSFKAAEVCELLKVQPYVLRTWEQEFKELGVAKGGDGPRVYRRRDVELAVRIRRLVFDEGLTLAGARRRLESERPPEPEPEDEVEVVDVAPEVPSGEAGGKGLDAEARARLRDVRDDLRALLAQLSSSVPEPAPVRQASSRASARDEAARSEAEPEPMIREFTLEPLEVEPYVDGDDASAAPVDADRGKRRRRGGR